MIPKVARAIDIRPEGTAEWKRRRSNVWVGRLALAISPLVWIPAPFILPSLGDFWTIIYLGSAISLPMGSLATWSAEAAVDGEFIFQDGLPLHSLWRLGSLGAHDPSEIKSAIWRIENVGEMAAIGVEVEFLDGNRARFGGQMLATDPEMKGWLVAADPLILDPLFTAGDDLSKVSNWLSNHGWPLGEPLRSGPARTK